MDYFELIGKNTVKCLMCEEEMPTGLLTLAKHRADCPCPGSHILIPGSERTDALIRGNSDKRKRNPPRLRVIESYNGEAVNRMFDDLLKQEYDKPNGRGAY